MLDIIGSRKLSITNIGGKGYNLLKLDRLGLTPNFLVISNSVFKQFLEQNNLLKYLNNGSLNDPLMLHEFKEKIMNIKIDERIINKIEEALDRLRINRFIARSSSCFEDSEKYSHAGLFESFRFNEKKDLPLYVKKVWLSQFSDKVLSYRRKNLFPKFDISVIIQEFINPDFGGVCFAQHRAGLQEILIEYSEKSFDGVTSGRSCTFTYLLRDGFSYISSDRCKDHRGWIQDLLGAISLSIKKYKNNNIDIEFAVSKNKIYLLQMRPLSRPFFIQNKIFLFGSRRYKWHIDDIEEDAFYRFLNDINVAIPFFKLIKKEGYLYLDSCPYFFLIDKLKGYARRTYFLDRFIDYNLRFVRQEKERIERDLNTSLKPLVISLKRFFIKMDFINYIIFVLKNQSYPYLSRRYNINEKKNPEYFTPELTLTSQILVNLLHQNNLCFKGEGKLLLSRLDNYDKEKLLRNIQTNRLKISKVFNRLNRRLRKHLLIFKKLVWLYDANNYYEENISWIYHQRLYNVLKKLGILEYFNKDLSRICEIPLSDIDKLVDKKYLSKFFQQKKSTASLKAEILSFPLRGEIASPGNFCGRAKIIRSLPDIIKIGKQDVMVAEYTQPSLVVGMAICKGIITEQGGLTSHAAIVSRELGKPCVVGVKGCMSIIKENDKLRVVNGLVYKVK